MAIVSCFRIFGQVYLSVYFLPAVGWEKVIEIRRFSNGTAIVVSLENGTAIVVSLEKG
ncbi:MAG: hypothetical protein LBR79_05605 [Oscillospiraceae bacterium]|nr:hypothetical protein [Oscillospiraceae bacterium]